MNITLINPNEREILNDAGDRAPLGLLYLADNYIKQGNNVTVYDLNHTPESQMLSELTLKQPELVGISCLSSPIEKEVKRLATEIGDTLDTKIVIGGYHASQLPNTFKGFADFVVAGEGENTELKEFINYGGPANLSNSTPRRDLLNHKNYNMQMNCLRTATAITSRGCPNDCVFCGNISKNVRFHSLDDIAKDLDVIKSQDYEAVYFVDDVFTIKPERAKQIASLCKDRGLKYRITTRANYMTEDLVKHLSDTGCMMVSMGVETGNDLMLQTIGKNQTKKQITNATALCYKYGIETKGFFILGLPGETETTARQTIEYSKELASLGMKSDFYPMIPFPGTKIYSNPGKFDIKILDNDYSHYLQATRNEIYVPCETFGLKANRIKELIQEARQ